jgi:hypothetical protein
MKQIFFVLALLALSSLTPIVGAQEKQNQPVVVFQNSDLDFELEGYYVLTSSDSLVGIEFRNGFNAEHMLYSESCFSWVLVPANQVDSTVDYEYVLSSRIWTEATLVEDQYIVGAEDGEFIFIRTCEGLEIEDETQPTQEVDGEYETGEYGEVIVVPVNDESQAWSYSDGFDREADNCLPNNPESCESFTILHPSGMSTAELRLHLAEIGIDDALFGNHDLFIGHIYGEALRALSLNMPEGNQLVVVGD